MRVILIDDQGKVTSATVENKDPSSGFEKPRHLEFEYGLNMIRNSWATLKAAKKITVEGDRVTLVYLSSLLAEHALKHERKEIIEKILEYNLGHSCRIRTVYEPDGQRPWNKAS